MSPITFFYVVAKVLEHTLNLLFPIVNHVEAFYPFFCCSFLTMTSYSVGQYVDVKSGDLAHEVVTAAYIRTLDIDTKKCTVFYLIERRIEKDVSLDRLQQTSVFSTTRRRQQEGCAQQPSLLMPTTTRIRNAPAALPTIAPTFAPFSVRDVLQRATKFQTTISNQDEHPCYRLLKHGERKQKGWLRRQEHLLRNNSLNNMKSNLQEDEKQSILLLKLTLSLHTLPFASLLAHAWGLDKTSVNRVVKGILKRKEISKRTFRKDKGKTVFNCDKKRKQFFTPYSVFRKKKQMNKQHSCDENAPSAEEIRDEWNDMSDNERLPFVQEANDHLRRAIHLQENIGDVLKRTRGSITWRQLETQLQGINTNAPIISYQTIRRHIMSLEGSCYRKNRFQPSLSRAQKQKRFDWCKSFWFFWNAARNFEKRTKVLLVHNDEKWFYAIVV